jgi:hypothetical protein
LLQIAVPTKFVVYVHENAWESCAAQSFANQFSKLVLKHDAHTNQKSRAAEMFGKN